MNVVLRGVWVAGLMLVAFGAQAQAPEHGHGYGAPAPQVHSSQHYDARYSHNYYYPVHGAYVTTLPHSPVVITRPGGNYYYAGGVWYRPYGASFVVVGAPIGVFVPVLPTYYTTLWVSGTPYYYANDTYYTWSPDQGGYQVVDPPSPVGYPPADPASAAPPTPTTPTDDLYAYPQAGQSAEQQSKDKYECHKWATSQSGFDPTQSGGGAVPPDQAGSARDSYQRAMSACLEGRGYSVR
jgi:hypothetical protein